MLTALPVVSYIRHFLLAVCLLTVRAPSTRARLLASGWIILSQRGSNWPKVQKNKASDWSTIRFLFWANPLLIKSGKRKVDLTFKDNFNEMIEQLQTVRYKI